MLLWQNEAAVNPDEPSSSIGQLCSAPGYGKAGRGRVTYQLLGAGTLFLFFHWTESKQRLGFDSNATQINQNKRRVALKKEAVVTLFERFWSCVQNQNKIIILVNLKVNVKLSMALNYKQMELKPTGHIKNLL